MYRWVMVQLCAASVFAAVSFGQSTGAASGQVPSPAPLASPIPAATPTPPQAATAVASPAGLEPLKVEGGAVLTFYLQTRLRPIAEDPLDALPQGTLLHVKLLRPIDSTVDRDGSEFHGWVVSDLALGDGVVIHADSEVRGLLVLLRSRNHPDGFRYELLLTELTDHGKSYPLTASLNPSFFDAPQHPAAAKVAAKESSKNTTPGNTNIPVAAQQ
jgi:hypothetical protein